MKYFKKNNKGFTLVELVVATAILSVVAVITLALVSTGTNMYNGVHKRTTLLYKSQVAAIQLQESVVDTKNGIAVYGSSFFVADKAANKIHAYYFNEGENAIYLRDDTVNTTAGNAAVTAGTETPFCYNVESVTFKPMSSKNADAEDIAYAFKFNITLNKFDVTYNKDEVLSLRNKPVLVSGTSAAEAEANLATRIWG